MLVNYTETRILSFGSTNIVPGINEVTPQVWAEMKKQKMLKHKIDEGILMPVRGTEKAEGVDAFISLSNPEIKKLIRETNNLELLSQWKEDETRASVINLIDHRVKELSTIEYRDGSTGELPPTPPKVKRSATADVSDDDLDL